MIVFAIAYQGFELAHLETLLPFITSISNGASHLELQASKLISKQRLKKGMLASTWKCPLESDIFASKRPPYET